MTPQDPATSPPSSPSSMSRLVWLGLLLFAYVALAFRGVSPFEDSFITYRYAEHIAQGHGAVWSIQNLQSKALAVAVLSRPDL